MHSMNDLTAGERLVIQRRREGLTQAQAAEALNVPLYVYRAAEKDVPVRPVASPRFKRVSDAEYCFLQRRRRGLTLADLSAETGLSTWWLCQMERGSAPVDTLLGFWTV